MKKTADSLKCTSQMSGKFTFKRFFFLNLFTIVKLLITINIDIYYK